VSDTKGTVSPLIATVLLIAFSFALGAVVLSWGESFVEERAQFVNEPAEVITSCQPIEVSALRVDGNPVGCIGQTDISVGVENLGPAISSLQATFVTPREVKVVDNVLVGPLGAGETRQISIPWSGGEFKQLKLVPRTDAGDMCPAKAIVLNNAFTSC